MKKLIIFALSLALFGCNNLRDYEPVTFTVSDDTLIMNGVIDSNVKSKLQKALNASPKITSIVMENVEGSVDDEANLEAARLVRNHKLNTVIPSNGLVASGGTDFFLSGTNRTAQKGAKIGVHSWAGEGIEDPVKLPRNHIEHQKYLRYYKEMGIPDEFYWYTLESAPSNDMHWMTSSEIKKYNITTE
ncbi:hypothetical protein NX722_13805 [Endozoicomonas gorgoniicola]|uniref:Alpha/beta hydrolase n=1 Tax=Endozoicomonas gorgoniicola TaxID=1234144 RepID=A0ABT3MWC6_9GAMM|nr:hypothetical protein [Endozoicomonas gorgoniicola]MCW7553684.1 hypothetical protein [Endozoicomonas gorgoniicola]